MGEQDADSETTDLAQLARQIGRLSVNMTSGRFLQASARQLATAGRLGPESLVEVDQQADRAARFKLINSVLFFACIGLTLLLYFFDLVISISPPLSGLLQLALVLAAIPLGWGYQRCKKQQNAAETQMRRLIYRQALLGDKRSNSAVDKARRWLLGFQNAAKAGHALDWLQHKAEIKNVPLNQQILVVTALLDSLRKLHAYRCIYVLTLFTSLLALTSGLVARLAYSGEHSGSIYSALVLGVALAAASMSHEYSKRISSFHIALSEFLDGGAASLTRAIEFHQKVGQSDTGMASLISFTGE